jgi:hypothetical protein
MDQSTVGGAIDDNALGPLVPQPANVGIHALGDSRLEQKAHGILGAGQRRQLLHLLVDSGELTPKLSRMPRGIALRRRPVAARSGNDAMWLTLRRREREMIAVLGH